MKKRTVITTEKREVWVISDGGSRRKMPDQQADVCTDVSESLTTANEDDSDASLAEKQKSIEKQENGTTTAGTID